MSQSHIAYRDQLLIKQVHAWCKRNEMPLTPESTIACLSELGALCHLSELQNARPDPYAGTYLQLNIQTDGDFSIQDDIPGLIYCGDEELYHLTVVYSNPQNAADSAAMTLNRIMDSLRGREDATQYIRSVLKRAVEDIRMKCFKYDYVHHSFSGNYEGYVIFSKQ